MKRPGSGNAGSNVAVAKCPTCRKENFAFAQFCISCGEPLDGEYSSPAITSSIPSSIDAGEPAAPSEARKSRIRESLVGLVLVLGVLGYAVYSWQHSAAQADAYHDGIAAQKQRDWDRAVAGFARAGDVQDAPKRKEEAVRNKTLRDNLYQNGISAASARHWSGAISALQQLQDIQPAFKDSVSRLGEARSIVFNQGLEGLLYLVNDGPEEGLYVRDGSGRSIQLPGSDGHSIVRAIATDDSSFVYDRPSKETDYFWPLIKHNSIMPDTFGPDKSDRIPVWARVAKNGYITTVPLPRLDPAGMGIFSAWGLWWFTPSPGARAVGYEVYYTALNPNPVDAPARVSDVAGDKDVLAVDPRRSQVILEETAGEMGSANRQTTLYRAEADGKNPRWLHNVQGDVLQASISQDGRTLLYVSQHNSGGLASRTVWVLPLDGGLVGGIESHWPRQLQILTWDASRGDARLIATFLPPQDGRLSNVLVDRVEDDVETLSVHDLERFSMARVWQGAPTGIYGRSMSGLSHDGSYLVSRRQQGAVAALELLGLLPGSPVPARANLPANINQIVRAQFSPLDDYIVASVRNRAGASRGGSQDIYATRIVRGASQLAVEEAVRIGAANLPYQRELSPVTLPYAGYLLVYVTPGGEMRAAFFDGSSTTRLADGVAAVWSLRPGVDLSWWR